MLTPWTDSLRNQIEEFRQSVKESTGKDIRELTEEINAHFIEMEVALRNMEVWERRGNDQNVLRWLGRHRKHWDRAMTLLEQYADRVLRERAS
jgi:hypothetical protein